MCQASTVCAGGPPPRTAPCPKKDPEVLDRRVGNALGQKRMLYSRASAQLHYRSIRTTHRSIAASKTPLDCLCKAAQAECRFNLAFLYWANVTSVPKTSLVRGVCRSRRFPTPFLFAASPPVLFRGHFVCRSPGHIILPGGPRVPPSRAVLFLGATRQGGGWKRRDGRWAPPVRVPVRFTDHFMPFGGPLHTPVCYAKAPQVVPQTHQADQAYDIGSR